MQKPLELTSIPFCTRAKTPWTNFKPFLHTCKTVMQTFKDLLYTCKTIMQTFKDLLYTTQNRHANVQGPFVHDAKPSCKCSKTFCSLCKTSMQMFRTSLFMIQNYIPLLPLHFSVNGLIHDLSGDTQTPCATSIYLCISCRNISEIAKYFLSAFVCKITMPLSR